METVIDWRDKDVSGKVLDLRRKLTAIRLRRWHIKARAQTSHETNLARAAQELERLKGLTGAPRPCVEQALEIYKQALKKELATGWPVEAMAAAALYMACRMLKTPRPLDELMRFARDKAALRRAAWRLNELLKGRRPPLEEYVKAVAARAGLPAAHVRRALEILEDNRKAVVGRNPWVMAAAALWLATYRRGMLKRLAEAAGVSNVSIKNTARRMKKSYEMAEEAVEEGKEVGSLRLADVRGVEVEVEGKRHVVTVLGGWAEVGRGRGGRPLLRIRIAAEVDGVRREYAIAFGRYGADNAVLGHAAARASAPGGKEADAERLAAVIKALTGREPWMRTISIKCFRSHLEALARYAELAEAIMKWLEG